MEEVDLAVEELRKHPLRATGCTKLHHIASIKWLWRS
jgi:hypothetical protein